MKRLFLSDLHLIESAQPSNSNQRQKPNNSSQQSSKHFYFANLLKADARLNDVQEVYLLGDIFEYWVDWQVAQHCYPQSLQSLQQLTSQVAVFFLPGNRDFMMSESEAKRLGMTLINDPKIIKTENASLFLTHGDGWVSDDSYRRLQRWIRRGWLQRLVRYLPLRWKISIANRLREKSIHQGRDYVHYSFVENQPLSQLDRRSRFAVKPGVSDAIFGHFHRPGGYVAEDSSVGYWQLGDLRSQPAPTDSAKNASHSTVSESNFNAGTSSIWVLVHDDQIDSNQQQSLQFVELLMSHY